jgi:hypothetical protein
VAAPSASWRNYLPLLPGCQAAFGARINILSSKIEINMTICGLCQNNEAIQKNSHIFPRFMGVSMLHSMTGSRRGYKIAIDDGIFKPCAIAP